MAIVSDCLLLVGEGGVLSDLRFFNVISLLLTINHFTPHALIPSMALTPENARILHDMLECDVRYLGEIGLNRNERVEFLDSMLRYYAFHLDAIHSVESLRILREVF